VNTVAAAFAGAVHHGRDRPALRTRVGPGAWAVLSWTEYGRWVRHVALALAESRDATVATAGPVWVLAGLAAGSVLDLDTPPSVDLAALGARGAVIDDERPDAFEAMWSRLTFDDVAMVHDGHTFTHGTLAWGVRSLEERLKVESSDRVLSTLPLSTPGGVVAGVLLAAVTGAELWMTEPTSLAADVADARPRVVFTTGVDLWCPPCVAGIAAIDGDLLPGLAVAEDDDGVTYVRGPQVAGTGWVPVQRDVPLRGGTCT